MKNLSALIAIFITLLIFNNALSEKPSLSVYNSGDSAICIVSDELITGEGVKLAYLGKEYVFCCEGCVGEFKAASIKYTNGIATCPVCNEDDAKETITSTHNDITYYFCSKGCKEKFEKGPEKVLEKYNK